MSRGWTGPVVGAMVLTVLVVGFSVYRFNSAHEPIVSARISTKAIETIRVGTFSTAIDYSPFYVAKNQGCLDSLANLHGNKIEYSVFDSLPAINDALASGRLDIILEADTPAIIQMAAGNDIKEVIPLASLSQELVVSLNSKARGLADLRGKRIGVLYGTGFHYGIVSGMAALGIKPDMYTLVNLAPAEANAALIGHTIDAWAVWPPFVQQQIIAGIGKAIPGSKSAVNVYVFGSSEFVKKNPSTVADFTSCIRKAITFIKENPDKTIALVSRETNLPTNVVSLAWPKLTFGLTVDDKVVKELNNQASFLLKSGYTSHGVIFDASFFNDAGDGK